MIGFLACINSDDPFLQYCGYLSVLRVMSIVIFMNPLERIECVSKACGGFATQLRTIIYFLTRERRVGRREEGCDQDLHGRRFRTN